MSQFTLDYTTQRPAATRVRSKKSKLARLFVLFLGWSVFSPLVVFGLLAGLFHYRAEHHGLHYQHQTQLLKYDSLLTAKQETDRRLAYLMRKQSKPTELTAPKK